jgi:hypothetical protein
LRGHISYNLHFVRERTKPPLVEVEWLNVGAVAPLGHLPLTEPPANQ